MGRVPDADGPPQVVRERPGAPRFIARRASSPQMESRIRSWSALGAAAGWARFRGGAALSTAWRYPGVFDNLFFSPAPCLPDIGPHPRTALRPRGGVVNALRDSPDPRRRSSS